MTLEDAIKAGLDATDGEWQSDRRKRETAIRTALFNLGFTREEIELLADGVPAEGVAGYHEVEWSAEDATKARRTIEKLFALLPTESGWTVVQPAESVSGSAGGSFSATSPTEDQ